MAEIDYGPRASGRTTRMMLWLMENEKRIMLTFSRGSAEMLRERYPLLSDRIFYVDEFKNMQRGMRPTEREIGVDNADMVLERHLGCPIHRMSLLSDSEEKDN